MDLGIAGRNAVVLGASKGLGGAIAAALSREGVNVLAVSRSGNAPEGSSGIATQSVDLSSTEAVDAFASELKARGDVDILVNNSGGPPPGPARGRDSAVWMEGFAATPRNFFAITDAVLDGMIARKWGRVITVASAGVVQPIPNLAISNAVRGAVAGWSKTLSDEVAPHGVTVNMLLPGRIDTDRVRSLDGHAAERTGKSVDEIVEAAKATIPTGRYGRADEFGAAGAFLASELAGYITGTMLRVDGGLIHSI